MLTNETFLCNRAALFKYLGGQTAFAAVVQDEDDQSVTHRCLVCLMLRNVFLSHLDI